MGCRGKVDQQNRARDLRAQAWTLQEIATELGVSKSSVSLWVRDVEFDQGALAERAQDHRNATARIRGPNKLQLRKAEEIDRLQREGRERIGVLSEREFLIAGTMLYAGEGSKTDGEVKLPNSDPRMVDFFLRWVRHFFEVDESKLRVRLYLHEGLDIEAANAFWSDLTEIPLSQFSAPYRAKPDPSIRRAKHPLGCPSVGYSSTRDHRAIRGLMNALLSSPLSPG